MSNDYKGTIGLWKSKKQDKNGNYYYGGKVENTEVWVNLYKVVSEKEKAPQLRIVLPEGYELVKVDEAPKKEVPAQEGSFQSDDIPF